MEIASSDKLPEISPERLSVVLRKTPAQSAEDGCLEPETLTKVLSVVSGEAPSLSAEDSSVDDTESLSISIAEELSSGSSSQSESPSSHPEEIEVENQEEQQIISQEFEGLEYEPDEDDSIEVQLGSMCPFQYDIEYSASTVRVASKAKSTLHAKAAAMREPETTMVFGKNALHQMKQQSLKRSVRFSLEKNQYHPAAVIHLTEEEYNLCWYSKESKERFREDSIRAARQVFLENDYSYFFSAWFDTQQKPKFNEYVTHILDAYAFCSEPTLETPVPSSKDNNSSTRTAPTNEGNDGPGSGELHPNHLKQYQVALREMYKANDDTLGLELFILTPFRGEPEGLRKFVLEQGYISFRQNGSSVPFASKTSEGEEEEEQVEEEHDQEQEEQYWTTKPEQQQRTTTTRKSRQQLEEEDYLAQSLAVVSRSISRPSRLLAHEFAKALADALCETSDQK